MLKELDPKTLLIYAIIILGILIGIYYALARWVFSIKRQLWNQKQQINLLIKINEKLGNIDDELMTIKEKNNKSDTILD